MNPTCWPSFPATLNYAQSFRRPGPLPIINPEPWCRPWCKARQKNLPSPSLQQRHLLSPHRGLSVWVDDETPRTQLVPEPRAMPRPTCLGVFATWGFRFRKFRVYTVLPVFQVYGRSGLVLGQLLGLVGVLCRVIRCL